MSTTATLPRVDAEQIEVFADELDVQKAARIFDEHGCLVVRGLLKEYVDDIREDILRTVDQSISLLPKARKVVEGWSTPDGSLFLPAPEGYDREQQIMCVAINYQTSGAFFRSALDNKLLSIIEGILGPNVEIFGNGQSLCKEPVGGHSKLLHQDSAYFEHQHIGPVAILTYGVDTALKNGALHVVPGSFKLGTLPHIDTFSHLGLDPEEWPWERATPIEGKAGDSIFFHVRCIHGSPENHSDSRRPIFIHRYRCTDDFVTVGGTTTENRAERAKNPSKKKSRSDRGLLVCGFREYEDEEA